MSGHRPAGPPMASGMVKTLLLSGTSGVRMDNEVLVGQRVLGKARLAGQPLPGTGPLWSLWSHVPFTPGSPTSAALTATLPVSEVGRWAACPSQGGLGVRWDRAAESAPALRCAAHTACCRPPWQVLSCVELRRLADELRAMPGVTGRGVEAPNSKASLPPLVG